MTAPLPMAITMGDASGVGPEIVLRRAAEGAFETEAVVVYGDLAVLRLGASASARVLRKKCAPPASAPTA